MYWYNPFGKLMHKDHRGSSLVAPSREAVEHFKRYEDAYFRGGISGDTVWIRCKACDELVVIDELDNLRIGGK